MTRGRRDPTRTGEAGGATVLVLATMGVVLVVTVAGLVLASTVAAGHRAAGAADLASLGGAVAWAGGASSGSACTSAADVARRNDVRLEQCSVSAHGAVTVTTAVRVGLALPGLDVARARARAGPDT